jgi:formylglycine-generating enzyme required for sulfatase activity
MPNDLGLFDMHGNVWCWCQESYKEYPRESQVFEDKEFDLEIKPQERRVLRGGCYTDHAPGVRAAKRWHHVPELRTNIIGFRLARTIATE